MKYTLLLCVLVASCSSKKMNVVDPEDYLKIHVVNKNQHKACIQHRDNVLEKAITESENPDLDDEQYYFPRNEKTALEFINSFDITKFTLKENQQEFQAIIEILPRQLLDAGDMIGRQIGAQRDGHATILQLQIQGVFEIGAHGRFLDIT